MDLYRLSEGSVEQLAPLNLDYVLNNCISLIEWPSRLGSISPDSHLEIVFRIIDEERPEDKEKVGDGDDDEVARVITLIPHGGKWLETLRNIEDGGYLDDMIIEYYDDKDAKE